MSERQFPGWPTAAASTSTVARATVNIQERCKHDVQRVEIVSTEIQRQTSVSRVHRIWARSNKVHGTQMRFKDL
ncbi:hypothetical protein EXIGLDRAFT_719432 [Exidia glandulosa HHB12029]|uniref:Uncharacterized protein n=1 Tax=Exidia glandulosa HHB12029 TaxID=1314781 RepID=A0A165H2T2_EXIGL|nr:hypothetical protein EXIGLDRAFT_719432 [Exidia glandulosa HHB12029]